MLKIKLQIKEKSFKNTYNEHMVPLFSLTPKIDKYSVTKIVIGR